MSERLDTLMMKWRLQSVVILLLGSVRIGLWILPFRVLQRCLASLSQIGVGGAGEADPTRLQRVASAVQTSSRYIPHATCLTQALVTQVLLERRGHEAVLRIGVARSEMGCFEAHAWVECEGCIVVGDSAHLDRYTVLSTLHGVASGGY